MTASVEQTHLRRTGIGVTAHAARARSDPRPLRSRLHRGARRPLPPAGTWTSGWRTGCRWGAGHARAGLASATTRCAWPVRT